MKRITLVAVALLGFAGTAHATKCNNGATNYPTCNNQPTTPTDPTNSNSNTNTNTNTNSNSNTNTQNGSWWNSVKSQNTNTATGGNASQGQGQDQGQSQSQSNAIRNSGNSTAQGGNATGISGGSFGGQGGSADNSGNSSVYIDSSAGANSGNYEAQALWVPDIIPAAPSMPAGGSLQIREMPCGPRVEKRSDRVYGTYVGMFKKSDIPLGLDEDIIYADEPYRYWTDPNGGQHVFGHRLLIVASQDGVAASRALSLGGGETGEGWGQGGVSSNSSMTRTAIRLVVAECEIPLVKREIPIQPPRVKAKCDRRKDPNCG
jgi:hypothetical protein